MTSNIIALPSDLPPTASEEIAEVFEAAGQCELANQIIRLYGYRTTVADDGTCEVDSSHDSLSEAADAYVADGDWGDSHHTVWVDVSAWHRWTLGDLTVDGERESFEVEIKPTVPPCSAGHEHDFVAPHAVVGGIRENPGVWGHGGGVVCHAVCRHCGCRRTTDTGANRPDTGKPCTTVTYAVLGEHDMSESWLAWVGA